MVIIGAKGHAKEVLQILQNKTEESIVFFDNVSNHEPSQLLYNQFRIINNFDDLESYFKMNSPIFCMGIGSTRAKSELVKKIEALGGTLTTVIANSAIIGVYEVFIGNGCNIMENVFISNSVSIGTGCLINYGAALHHDVTVGSYCEISPKAVILGRCKIGDFVSLGANSTILPDITIGDNSIIGAGAVVTKNVKSNTTVVGIPAK